MAKQENDSKPDETAKPETAAANTNAAASQAGATQAQTSDKTPAKAQDKADAIALLRADHRKVETLFAQYESASDSQKDGLVEQICAELVIHTLLEEEIFYPACRRAAEDEDPLDEAQVEHDSAKMLIQDLMRSEADDPYRDAKVKVLSEQIKHHVAEEEKPGSGIFAKAQSAGLDLADLGRRLQMRKQQLQARGDALPAARPVSFQLPMQRRSQKEDVMPRGRDDFDRDDRGRFTGDDDRGYRSRGADRDRDDRGRFARDDDDDRRGGYRSRGRDDDGGRGWYGDPEGHAEASRRGWAERGGGESRSFSRGRDDDDDRGYSSRGGGRDRDERGRFTSDDDDRGYRSRGRDDDDRGYRARGADRDRDDRGRFMTDDDDDRRGGYRSRGRDDDDGRGWYGDSEGHSEAARRGWAERNGGGGRTRGRDDDDDRGYRSRSRDDDDRGRGHGGWFGDSRGHAEAARRGWQDRR